MISRDEILANLERYDLKKAKIGVVGSHSGLDTCDGATSEGFHTVAICQDGREKTFNNYFRTQRDSSGKAVRGCVDETIILPKFANILDAYAYLGAADITVQTQFGINYVKDFMGYSTLFLLPAAQIARGKVLATPVENIDLYYIDPGDSEFAKLGLQYTVQGETNLIGFHAQGNYSTAVGESYALMGMALWAEYLDGIAAIDIGTESFSAVSSPTGNPAEKMYYEKDASNNYFRTTDTTVVSGKTYYTRTVTAAA